MRPRTARHTLIALTLAATFAIAGCGGDSGSETTSGDTQPAADLVEQADAICTQANADRPQNAPELSANASAKDLEAAASYFEDDLKVTQDAYDQLSALTPPEGKEDAWAKVLDGFRAVTEDYPQLIDAAKAGDDEQFVAVVKQIARDTDGLQPAAAEVGLQVCATPQG
jgi:hypothetical protein